MHEPMKKRHLLAFFCLYTSLLQTLVPVAWAQASCAAPADAVPLNLKSVIDGDTVITSDGTHIRLIGIDTPEIDYRRGHAEPLAYRARDFLKQLIRTNTMVLVQYGTERTDQYGRTLAHLFLVDGTNIQLHLLQSGLAVPLTYPPNTQHSDCYYRAADTARMERRGLWDLPDYQTLAASELPPDTQGYRVISMKVKSIVSSKYSLTINTESDLVIRIPGSSLYLFESRGINRLTGNQITVQGELFREGDRYRMMLRHPRQLALNPLRENNGQTE